MPIVVPLELLQLSVQFRTAIGGTGLPGHKLILLGILVKTGGKVSTIVITWVRTDMFPVQSVTDHDRMI